MKPIFNNRPTTVWYIAAGYKLPAGIEAYLLHYATELRNQGFNTRIIVFQPLPKVPHRFLVALREREIPIESLYESIASQAHLLTLLTILPLTVRRVIGDWLSVIGGGGKRVIGYELKDMGNTNNQELITNNYSSLLTYWRKRLAVRELRKMIKHEAPDIIHVKGRLITEAWPVFPSERTIYQHALMGTRDPSWEDSEAEAFSTFLNRIAGILVQGKGIAQTFAQAFNIRRKIDVVYTMAPDEAGGLPHASSDHRRQTIDHRPCERIIDSQKERSAPCELRSNVYGLGAMVSSIRFGILARFTEQKGIAYILEALKMYKARHGAVDFTFAGQGPMEALIRETTDIRPQTAEPREENTPHLNPLPQGERKDGNQEFRPFAPSPFRGEGWGEGRHLGDNSSRSMVSAPGSRIVPVESAVKALEQFDVFVHPGLDDAMPVSIVEALMCGVPCIVSNVGASPELVRNGVEGLVIEPASAEQILRAMERFAAMSEDELKGFKERARLRYEEACRPEVVGAQVAALYRGIAGSSVERGAPSAEKDEGIAGSSGSVERRGGWREEDFTTDLH